MSDRIIFTLIGILVGGVAGGIIAMRFCGKDYKKRIDELERENRQLVTRARKEKEIELKNKEEKIRIEGATLDNSIMTQIVRAREEKRQAEEMVRDHGYSDFDEEEDEDEDIDFDDPFEEEEIVIKPAEPKAPSFKRMSQEEYEEDFEYRDSEALTYYQEDHVLADVCDDRIGNPENVIGEEALLEADATDAGRIYVLDENEDKMYEIEINHEDSYYRDILRGGV